MADTFKTLFNRAVEIAGGSETKLALAAGCSQNAIWHAKRAGRVSAKMAVRIETATDGQITRGMLRPDLWPEPPGALSPPGFPQVAPSLRAATEKTGEAA